MIKCALCGKTLEEVTVGSSMHTAKGCVLSWLWAWDENWKKINAAIEAAREQALRALKGE